MSDSNADNVNNVVQFVPRPTVPAPRPSLQCLELVSEGRELKITIRDPSGGSRTVGPYQLQGELAGLVMTWLREAWEDRRDEAPCIELDEDGNWMPVDDEEPESA